MEPIVSLIPYKLMQELIQKSKEKIRTMKKINNLNNSLRSSHIELLYCANANQKPNNADDIYEKMA